MMLLDRLLYLAICADLSTLVEVFVDALVFDVAGVPSPALLTLKSGAPLSATRLGSCWTLTPRCVSSAISWSSD